MPHIPRLTVAGAVYAFLPDGRVLKKTATGHKRVDLLDCPQEVLSHYNKLLTEDNDSYDGTTDT